MPSSATEPSSATDGKPATGAESGELVISNEESESEFFSKL